MPRTGCSGSFDGAGGYGFWWSATEYDAVYAWYRTMDYSNTYENWSHNNKTRLYSVRCVAD